jgi:ABC-2 type transport system permease protein
MHTLKVNLQLFWQGAVLSYRALFQWLTPAVYLASKIVSPFSQMIFFTLLGTLATGAQTASFYVIGNAMQIAAMSGIYGATMSIGGDRGNGTLPYLFGTPANRLLIFAGRVSFHILDGMLNVVIGFVWGLLILGLDLSRTDLPALALTILITTFSTSGLGLLMGCLSLITVNVMLVNNAVYFVLLVLSGANIPVASLPAPLQVVSEVLPLTHGIRASRLLIAGADLAQVAPLLGTELLIGISYALLGYVMFRWFETQAKKRGTLEIV